MDEDDQAAAEAFQTELEQREFLELKSYEHRNDGSWPEWYRQIHEPAEYEAG